MLTTENKIWAEITSKKLDVTPESLINGILRQVRTEIGNVEDSQTLEGWIKKSANTERKLDSILTQAKEALRTTEETVKAAQLYLNQLQRSEYDVVG